MSAERTVQMNSVLTILSDSIEKLKISLILPRLLERPCILRKVLDNTKYSHCLKLIEDYINERQDSKDETSSYLDYRLIKIIDFFHINTNILELLPGWMDELDDNDVSLLKAFKLLRWITEQRLNKSAVEELKKEKKIHEIFHENEKFKKNIEEFKHQLKSQRINLRWKLAAKESVIKSHEQNMALKKALNDQRIKEEMAKTSRSVRHIYTASVARRRELEEELRMTKVNYEKLVNDNIRQEKNARAEKNKLLLQLEALIKKFDQSIGDKMREKIVLEEEYAKQKKIFDEFMIIFREKEAEYEVAVVQKEQEEREQQEKKLAFFIMNRAARIIQRFYRKYRKAKKRLEKQLQKRGKGAARRKGKK
ncbi:dynein regulatory complex protein 10-like [Glossina fuscipes]|uniref:Dynein regulatory complex protein 10 n=1 Tax=Glossina fuscipes TaxID=7396 RepID=A0A9C5Z209_9MUSC|nr:dynein regulatory complex protein 10-like [Glossina fuscipes]